MTLEQLKFTKEQIGDSVYYKRESYFSSYNEYIVFNLYYKEIEYTNLDSFDMILLEAIYVKAKELFEE